MIIIQLHAGRLNNSCGIILWVLFKYYYACSVRISKLLIYCIQIRYDNHWFYYNINKRNGICNKTGTKDSFKWIIAGYWFIT